MTKFIFIILLLISAFVSFTQQKDLEKINRPESYKPSKSKFYVHNEIEIYAAPERV